MLWLFRQPIPTPTLPLKGRGKLYFSPFKGEIERGMGGFQKSILF